MADSTQVRTSIVETTDNPMFWEPSRTFLKWAITCLLAGGVIYLIVSFVFYPARLMRAVGPAALSLVAAIAWFLLARGRIKAAVLVLAFGVWTSVSCIAVFFGGLRSTTVVIYPLIIIMVGWLIGGRWAAGAAILTALTTLGIAAAESRGILPYAVAAPPVLYWLVQCAAVLFSALMISYLARSYRGRLKEAHSLSSDLARRSAEARASENDLNRAQAIAHVGSLVYDFAGDTLHLSAETCRIFGLPVGTTGNRESYFARVHPDDREAVTGAWEGAISGGKPFDIEHRIVVGETIRWIRQKADLEFDPDGRPLRGIGTTQDITERKRYEAEILATRSQLAATLDAIPDLLFEVDLDGRFYAYHSKLKDRLLVPPPGFLGKTVYDILPAAAAAVGMSAVQEAHEKGRSTGREYELQLPQGSSWFELSVTSKPVDPGQVLRFIVLSRDITERKRAEAARAQLVEQLRESQKMESLGTLAGGVAHDFNNIVATIMGNAELALEDVGPGHAAQESLEEIRKASLRAKSLVQQILAFSRRQVLTRQVIALAPVVEDAVRLLRATLPAGVNLKVECAPDAPPVLADATQVEQVLLNLCANAWQAMQGQQRPAAIEIGLLSYAASEAQYAGPERRSSGGRVALRPGRYACLTVCDTGPGMDAATRSRIFEPFFTTKPVGKGTGLGLSVVHGIVQDHGASIAVHSAPGKGTSFRISFPASQQAAVAAPVELDKLGAVLRKDSEMRVLHEAGKSILYVDDDEAIVLMMTRLLERQGYRVSGYTEALEALEAVRSQPEAFDLVVTDYNMPDMSGLELARALREIRADLQVALASGYITEELRAQAPVAGVSELIYKPNTVDELSAVIARLANTQPV